MANYSDYVIHYLRSKGTPQRVIEAFDGDTDFARYFSALDRSIIRHLMTGDGDWVTFLNDNPDIAKRMERIDATIEADIDYSYMGTWAAAIVRDWQKGAIKRIAQDAQQQDSPLAYTSFRLNDLDTARMTGQITDGKDASKELYRIVAAIQNGGEGVYLKTGMSTLDAYCGGLTAGKIVALGGLWNSGKTLVAGQWAYDGARLGTPTVWIQWEMRHDEIQAREVARQSGVSLQDIRQGRGDLRTWELANEEVEGLPVLVSAMETRARALDLYPILSNVAYALGRDDFLIVIDHILHMRPTENGNEADKAKTIYNELQSLLSPNRFPNATILALQHLNKGILGLKGKQIVPSLGDFEYGGVGTAQQAFIVVRPLQHLRQFPHMTPEKLDAMRDTQPYRHAFWHHGSFLWLVKDREVEANKRFGLRYQDYELKEHEWTLSS